MTGKTNLIPVNTDVNISTIREFRKTLQTMMGPSGSIKLTVSGGSYIQLTSASSCLLDRIELENPICRYIGLIAKGLPSFGLYFGIFVSHLLELQWVHEVSKQELMKILTGLMPIIRSLLKSQYVCTKVNFDSVNNFLPMVRTIVLSKSIITFGVDIEKLCLEVVKVFLNCVDDKTGLIGRVFVKVESGTDYIASHNGLLYQLTESHNLKIIKQAALINKIKIIIFTTKLENNEKENISILKIISLLEQAITLNVTIVACQQTVDEEIKLYLQRKGVILLDRMGSEFTSILVQVSHAFPISQLVMDPLEVKNFTGVLTKVDQTHFNHKDYILLANECEAVGTILVQTWNLMGKESLKVLVEEAIGALRTLAAHPAVTPGGGCLEVWLIGQLLLLQNSQNDKNFCLVSSWLQQALLSSCGAAPPIAMDSVYHHAWDSPELHGSCRCGLISASSIEEEHKGTFIYLTETKSQSRQELRPPKQPEQFLNYKRLVDCHQLKLNCILLVLEVFCNISDIGAIVFRD